MTLIGKLARLLSAKEKKIVVALLFASILISFLETFGLSLVMLFATVATNFDKIASNRYYAYAYKTLHCSSPSQFVIIFGLCLIAFYVFRGAVISLFTYAQSRFSQGRFHNFAFRFFQNYLNFKYRDFTANNSSKISKVIFSDAMQMTQIILGLLIISAESLTIACIYFTLLFVNWKMTAVLTFLLSAKVFFIVKAFSSRLAKAGKKTSKLNVEMARTFSESFGNFKLIKLFSNERSVLKRFNDASCEFVRANTLNTMLQNSPRVILESMGFSILIAVIVYIVYMHNNASNVVPIISMYAFAFYRFLPSINKVLSEYNRVTFLKHSLDSIQSYLSYDLEDLGDYCIDFKNKIELKNVSFSYDVKSKILQNVDLIIKKGQRTAFVGESGAGKSTLVDILIGLYKPGSGKIFIDDRKLDSSNVKSWRNKIGYIPQHVYLFDGTIAQNVAFGREYDEQKIIDVLKRANIYDFLLTQNGIHSKAGEQGIMLSGGQRQRIAIARALYSDPEVLVLDEATSALDNQTEQKIMDEIYGLNKDKTLIIVAHRLTTVERCENIYKVEKGKISLVDDLYALYNQKKVTPVVQKQV